MRTWVGVAGMMAAAAMAMPAPAAAPTISMGATRLTYTPDANGNNIPDFSYVGYKGGGVSLPTLTTKQSLSPAAGGADNTTAIQNAINTVSALTPDANGFRGAVVLAAGTYPISGSLTIAASGVVLRGAGVTTILKFTGTARAGITISGSGGAVTTGSAINFSSSYVPLGAKSFTLASAPGYAVGDQIVIHRPWTQTWIDAMGMGTSGPLGSEGWTPNSAAAFERTVTAVSGNTVTVDIPMMTPFDPAYTTGTSQKITDTGRIQFSGVEKVKILAAFTDAVLFNGAVTINKCKNCWVKNLTIDSWGDGVEIVNGAKFITVQDCTYQNGYNNGSARPFCYDTDGQMCFFNRCVAISGFEHIVSTQSSTAGPNVWLNTSATNASSFDGGPHQKWALGNLFDNPQGAIDSLKIYNAGTEGTGHGWVTGYSVIYNPSNTSTTIMEPPLAGHYNWLIGGTTSINTTTDMGEVQNAGTMVSPQSLYLQQLSERLGTSAISNIGYTRFTGDQKIFCRHSGYYLNVKDASLADNAVIRQIGFDNRASEHWTMTDIGSGYYTITNGNSGKVLAILGNSTATGAQAVQNTYSTAGTAGEWQIVDTDSGYSKIINHNSGKALEIIGDSLLNGAELDQAPYTGALNQQFQVVPIN